MTVGKNFEISIQMELSQVFQSWSLKAVSLLIVALSFTLERER